ncbi:MAG: DNA-(apurinic or apyrimidinic site) lyase [Geobacteraceae bacterium]|nr:DNA-(apurinic or apyrimidinic site) lyase [Geobacteraceae bacterium]
MGYYNLHHSLGQLLWLNHAIYPFHRRDHCYIDTLRLALRLEPLQKGTFMPELPEVEVARRRIAPHAVGRIIQKLIVRNYDLRWPVPDEIQAELPGQTVLKLDRRGKYLVFRCSEGNMILHFGMNGNLHRVSAAATPGKHDHLDIVFTDGVCLRFTDPRRFGSVLWTRNDPISHRLLKGMGPEPLTDDFNGEYLFQRSRGRRITVKQFIMNSAIVSGLGNIYAAEAMFHAGIHPATEAGAISAAGYNRLAAAIREVLVSAIDQGMNAACTNPSGKGDPGYFPVLFFVYGRAGEPCRQCGTSIQKVRQAGRSTWFCPNCQK